MSYSLSKYTISIMFITFELKKEKIRYIHKKIQKENPLINEIIDQFYETRPLMIIQSHNQLLRLPLLFLDRRQIPTNFFSVKCMQFPFVYCSPF